MKLEKIRKSIDSIDDEILNLFLKRLELCKEIGKLKKDEKLPVFDSKRENEILSKVKEKSGKGFKYTKGLFLKIFEICKEIQEV